MRNTENGAAEAPQGSPDDGAGERDEVSSGLIQQQNICLPQDHIQKQKLLLLTAAEGSNFPVISSWVNFMLPR